MTDAVLEISLGNIRLFTKPRFGGAERRKFFTTEVFKFGGSGRDSV